MAFKPRRSKHRRKPFKRVVYPSKAVDCYDIKYLDGGSYQEPETIGWSAQGEARVVDVEIRRFDVYKNGLWLGTFDNSVRGLLDFAEAML